MASVAETFWAEVLARLVAAPTWIPVSRVQRGHRTPVTRENSPAVHLIEGRARPTAVKRCDWQWEMDGTIAVFVRDNAGSSAADPFVVEVVNRINSDLPIAYSNGVLLELGSIEPDTEIADEDASRVNIQLLIKFGTKRWTWDLPVA